MNFAAALKAFAAVFPAELPDKTMIATVVLVTRYRRPLPVWAGAAAAFTLHVVVAVAAGGLLTLLPETAVKLATALLFATGAVILWRTASSHESEAESELIDVDADAEVPGDPAGQVSPPPDAADAHEDQAESELSDAAGATPDGTVELPEAPPDAGLADDAWFDAVTGAGSAEADVDTPDDAGTDAGSAALDARPAVGGDGTTGVSGKGRGGVTGRGASGAAEVVGAGRGGAAALPSAKAAMVGSFGVIALAEWGDLTQFATAGMAASTGAPVAVAIGALLALWAVAGLAVTVGRGVTRWLPIHVIQRVAAGVFGVLALSVLWSLRS